MSTGGERKNGLLSLRRRNTFSGGTSGGWKGRKKRRGSEEEEKRLSCVLEDISACGSSPSCSQLVGYRREEKVFPVQYKTESSSSRLREAREEDNRVTNEAALKDKRHFTKSASSCSSSSTTAAIMAWRASRCGSPSTYDTLQHSAAPPATTTTSSTSWIDSLRLLTDKGSKKKGNGLFGTLRGRNSRDKSQRNSSESVASSSGSASGPPRSPLLLGRHLNNTPSSSNPELGSSSNHKSGSVKTQKLYIGNNSKHSLQGRNSTGFQMMDSTDSHDLDSSLSPLSLSLSYHGNEFGSCHQLSYEHNPSSLEDRTMSAIRKSTSLPRTVLCSPVHTRRNKGERPTSHWLMREIFDPAAASPSSSPPCTFSHNGSSDTLQNDATTPTETDEWRFKHPLEPVLKTGLTGLTRSTSMPFESGAEIIKDKSVPLRKKAVTKDGVIKEKRAGGPVAVESGKGNGTRLTMRSQSFNTHFSVLAQETVSPRVFEIKREWEIT